MHTEPCSVHLKYANVLLIADDLLHRFSCCFRFVFGPLQFRLLLQQMLVVLHQCVIVFDALMTQMHQLIFTFHVLGIQHLYLFRHRRDVAFGIFQMLHPFGQLVGQQFNGFIHVICECTWNSN